MTTPGRLLGQGEELERLLAAARVLQMPHGLVVAGAAGTGKSTAARWIASALLCGGAAGTAIGGDCPCSRRVFTGNHPDLHLVERPEDKQDIPVDRVRELQAELEHLPVEGRARVAIVDPADRLNEQGQNALLKTLEEPGPDTFLLLVTSRPEALLETVRSRAASLRLRPLDDATLRDALGGAADPARLKAAVGRAAGSLGVAATLLRDDVRAIDEALAAFLARPSVPAVAAARVVLEGVTGRQAVDGRVRTVLALLGGRLRARLRQSLAEHGNAGYLPPAAEHQARAVDAVLAAEQDLGLGIPPTQVLDGVLLGIVDALATSRV